MRKAHLFEAAYQFNQGIDEAVSGVLKLKKVPGFVEELYGGTLARLEHARAQVNLQFFDDMHDGEQQDATRFALPDRSPSTKDSQP